MNYFRNIFSTRITNFYIILINYFSKWVIIFEMVIKPRKYFCILILEGLQKGGLNQIIFLHLFF